MAVGTGVLFIFVILFVILSGCIATMILRKKGPSDDAND